MVMSLIAKQIAKKVSKNIGKKAKDLGTPSSVSTPGSGKSLRGATPANKGGLRSSQIAAQTAAGFDKALSKKQKQLKTYSNKRDSLTGVDKIKFIAQNQTMVKSLKASIEDMKKRGGPRVERKGGGMTRQGLSPAEEARAGTMSQAKRKKYMNKGGLVKRKKPGKIGSGDKFVRDCYK